MEDYPDQGTPMDVAGMEVHSLPDATDSRWAFTHNLEGIPAMPPVKPKKSKRKK